MLTGKSLPNNSSRVRQCRDSNNQQQRVSQACREAPGNNESFPQGVLARKQTVWLLVRCMLPVRDPERQEDQLPATSEHYIIRGHHSSTSFEYLACSRREFSCKLQGVNEEPSDAQNAFKKTKNLIVIGYS
jgi:hypothetical protein